MPQRQHVENYDLNQSDCDNKPLPHIHEETSYRTGKSYRQPTYAERQRKKEYQKASGAPAGRRIGIILAVVVIAVAVCIGSVASMVRDMASPLTDDMRLADIFNNETDFGWEEESLEDYSPLRLDDIEYYDAVYDMPTDGDVYDIGLSAGNYKVGYHLPEGTYELTAVSGCGTIDVEDDDNNIYLYEWLDSDEESGYRQISNLKLYQGAFIFVSGGVEVTLSAANAQSQLMAEGMPNELTKSVPVDSEALMAGRDFPAGVYDIFCTEGFGVVYVYEKADGDEEPDYSYMELMQSSEDAGLNGRLKDYAMKIYNIELETGMCVEVNDMSLELIPSDTVFLQEGE